jgi:hypothetical protein
LISINFDIGVTCIIMCTGSRMGRRIAENVESGERGEREPYKGAGEGETAIGGDKTDQGSSGEEEG